MLELLSQAVFNRIEQLRKLRECLELRKLLDDIVWCMEQESGVSGGQHCRVVVRVSGGNNSVVQGFERLNSKSRLINLSKFEVGDPAKTPSRLVGWLALLLVGGILAMGGIFWRSYYAPAVSLPSLVHDNTPSSAELTQRQTQASKLASGQQYSNGPVVFTALEEGIWVKFYGGDGKQLMQKQLAKGESYYLPGDAMQPKLWTGRPDALAITIGGKAIPRLADAEKVMKDVPVDAASLRARRPIVPPPQSATPTPVGR